MPGPDLLRLVDEHLAGVTGDEFFVALVKSLAQALDVRCSFVTELNGDGGFLTPLAFYCDDQLLDVPGYDVAGTPCECVLAGDIVAFDQNVVDLFPDHRHELEAIDAESYLAIPLKNRHGRIMGHLAVVDSEVRAWDDTVLGVFRIFAARATAELERRQFETELAQQNADLERRVEKRTRELEAANARLLTEVVRVQSLAAAHDADEARFQTLFENSPISIWELDLSAVKDALREVQARGAGDFETHFREHPEVIEQCMQLARIQRINRRTLELYGAIEPRMLMERFGSIMLPESYEKIGSALARLWHGESHTEFELWDSTLAGERRLRHVQWSVPAAARDTWNTVIVSVVDVTDDRRMREALHDAQADLEKRIADRTATLSAVNTQLRHEIARRIKTEEALSEQQDAYRDLYENAPNVYWSTGTDGLIKRANQQAAKIFGYTVEELEGKPLATLVADGPDGEDKARVVFQRFLEGKPTYDEEVRFRAADGSDIWATVNVVPVLDAAGKPSHTRSLLTDITARKRLEDDLKRARRDAEAASQAKSDFLASMSHELRTPLNAILGYTQLMDSRGNLDPRQKQEVGRIRRAGEHLLTLINDLLDLASVEAGKLLIEPRAVRLRAMVCDVAEIIGMRAGPAGISFDWDVADDAPENVLLDDRRVRQILINLLGNAVKFTPEGGAVRLAVTAESRGPDAWLLSFAVRDNGVGIPEEQQEQVFEAFHQLQKGADGTGLGLAITRRLAVAMGGKISLESVPGQGSVFTATLATDRPAIKGRRKPASTAGRERAVLPAVRPPTISNHAVVRLLELARMGDVSGIERCLDSMADDASHRTFVDGLRQLSERFDMRGIQSYLTPLVDKGLGVLQGPES